MPPYSEFCEVIGTVNSKVVTIALDRQNYSLSVKRLKVVYDVVLKPLSCLPLPAICFPLPSVCLSLINMYKNRVYDVTYCYNLGKKCLPPY